MGRRSCTCIANFTRLRGVPPADALIRPRFIPISRFDKSICRAERSNFKVLRPFNRGAAPWKFFSRLCVCSRGYFKFQRGSVGCSSCIDISTSARVMRWKTYISERYARDSRSSFCPCDSFSTNEPEISVLGRMFRKV